MKITTSTPRRTAITVFGFTLIELLVVIAIIAIIAAFLLPVLSRAKSSARGLSCISNTSQISLATCMYADDHNDFIPYANQLSFGYEATPRSLRVEPAVSPPAPPQSRTSPIKAYGSSVHGFAL